MARITHVKKAQQRYRQVPVLDEHGNVVQTPVMRRDGTQKVTKNGRPVVMRQTVADKSQPLPPLTCEFCRKPIEIGTPYKHVTPHGSSQRNRHATCPTWEPWDLTNAWWARIAQATADFNVSGAENPDEVRDALQLVADGIRELAEESREVASNIEDGFGHPTVVSEEAEARADALEGWAEEIEGIDVPDLPEPEPEDRWYVVNGVGDSVLEADEGFETEDEAIAEMENLKGTPAGRAGELKVECQAFTASEPTQEQMDAWVQEVEDCCDPVNNSPI